MFYCNCTKSWSALGYNLPGKHKASGKNIPDNFYTREGIHNFHPIEVTKQETCVHCGFAAVFSKVPLDSIGNPIKEAQ